MTLVRRERRVPGAVGTPVAFASPGAFRAWLAANHARVPVLVVRCFKTRAVQLGVTYAQALDEALCFGWIDGVRHALDADSFCVRFTPRRKGSRWSAVNRRRAAELDGAGRMHPSGRAALRAAPSVPAGYSYEQARTLPAPLLRRLRADARARAFYEGQPPWYRRTAAFWVMSARRPETRERRLAELVSCSARGRRIPPLAREAAAARPRSGDRNRPAGRIRHRTRKGR